MVNVTKTYLPDREKYKSYVDRIFDNGWVTNNGELVQELEKRLAEYLGVKNIVLVANGTIAMEIAYRLLKLSGEVITTPFSFVATTSTIVANGLTPKFADVLPDTLTISPEKIEEQITAGTSAIVPVHVYGTACEVEKIAEIAEKNNLKVIYDGAHSFGVKYKGKSLLTYGDVTTLSFHATKIFHTIEGGALIINDDSLVQDARFLINFGIDGPDSVKALGTNAKMNEFEAAMGLCVLDDIEQIVQSRKTVFERYIEKLAGYCSFPDKNSDATLNYCYFPVIFPDETTTMKVKVALEENGIFTRRYFSPSLDTLPYVKTDHPCVVSRDITRRILSLPMFDSLEEETQDTIIRIVKEAVK